jgi:hypothetical protein
VNTASESCCEQQESLQASQSLLRVKCGRGSGGTRNQESLCWRGPEVTYHVSRYDDSSNDTTFTPTSTKYGHLLFIVVKDSGRPRGLSLEMSSAAQTLESWVRTPLEAWLSTCVYSVFVSSCVGSGLATCSSPLQGILSTVYKI